MSIDNISFGVYSTEEIEKIAVCLIDQTQKSGYGSIYDERMGPNDVLPCVTCKKLAGECMGHFGYIKLNIPVVNPLFYTRIDLFLRVFCYKCYGLLLSDGQFALYNLYSYKNESRFNFIQGLIKKKTLCPNDNCRCYQPQYKYNPDEQQFFVSYDEDTQIPMTPLEIYNKFNKISNEDVTKLGFDPNLMHPRNFIMESMLVLPNTDRPFVETEEKTTGDDDLTIQYCEIIKINNLLKRPWSDELTPDLLADYERKLKYKIATTFNNCNSKAKQAAGTSRQIRCIVSRMGGKTGHFRENAMGKRTNKTGRTVISPNPMLRIDELGFPAKMANNLTIPIHVSPHNIDEMTRLMYEGKIVLLRKSNGTEISLKKLIFQQGTKLVEDDIIIRDNHAIPVLTGKEPLQERDILFRDFERYEDFKVPHIKTYQLEIGDVVYRTLKDGDYVLFNRQPTLHAASMQAMKIKIYNIDTLNFNVANCKPFNADFDGDEMNIHVPQSVLAISELMTLSMPQNMIVSQSTGKACIVIVQDALLGSYKMSMPTKNSITRDKFFQIMTHTTFSSSKILRELQRVAEVFEGNEEKIYSGRGIISMILPSDFIYEKKNNTEYFGGGIHNSETLVKIYRGVFVAGILDGATLGSSTGSIIQTLYKEYSKEVAGEFIDNIQFVANQWLLMEGFTISLNDCVISTEEKNNIKNIVYKTVVESAALEVLKNKDVRESRINNVLNRAKDLSIKIARDSLRYNNNLLSSVNSGSKGNPINLTQISGIIGQQNINSQRIPLSMNNGERSIIYFPKDAEIPLPTEKVKSRGFIASNYLDGLDPVEFYSHMVAAREGIINTGTSTADTGYMQRKHIKVGENNIVSYNNSVIGINNQVVQSVYGNHGYTPTQIVKTKHGESFCDVRRLVNKLNLQKDLKTN